MSDNKTDKHIIDLLNEILDRLDRIEEHLDIDFDDLEEELTLEHNKPALSIVERTVDDTVVEFPRHE